MHNVLSQSENSHFAEAIAGSTCEGQAYVVASRIVVIYDGPSECACIMHVNKLWWLTNQGSFSNAERMFCKENDVKLQNARCQGDDVHIIN
jgi:hypothetical protein